jgi:multiple sugar transport system permease protein
VRIDGESRGLALLLAPYVVGLSALVFGPALVTFALALFEYDLLRAPSYVGLGNFRELWGDEVFGISVRNSLVFAAAAVPIRLAGALALALLLHERFRGAGGYRTAAYLPTVVPDVAYALLWLWLLNPLYGPINVTLRALGVDEPRWLTDPTDAQQAIVLMSVFQLGEGFLVALAARQSLPRELYELTSLEAASAWFVLTRVTLPLMLPVLLLLAFRDTIYSFQASFVPALLVTEGGPPPYATTYLPVFTYQNAFEYLRYGYAAAATLVMLAITAALVYAQWLVLRRWRRRFAV